MMKGLTAVSLAVFLLLALTAFAGDGKPKKMGNYPQQKGDKLQEYKNDIPQQGNYYKWDGKKWQRYEGNIPQVGYYLKEIERLESGKGTKLK
jgi:hypothetical protein